MRKINDTTWRERTNPRQVATMERFGFTLRAVVDYRAIWSRPTMDPDRAIEINLHTRAVLTSKQIADLIIDATIRKQQRKARRGACVDHGFT